MDQEEQKKNKKRKKRKESGDDLEKEKARQRDTETKHMISLSRFCEIYLIRDGPFRRWLKEKVAKGYTDAVALLDSDDTWRVDAIAFLKTRDTTERRAAVKKERSRFVASLSEGSAAIPCVDVHNANPDAASNATASNATASDATDAPPMHTRDGPLHRRATDPHLSSTATADAPPDANPNATEGSAATGQPGVLQPDANPNATEGSAATGQPGVLQPDAPPDPNPNATEGSAATGQPGVLQPDAPPDPNPNATKGSAATGQPGVLQPDAPSEGSAATGQPGVLQPEAPSEGSAVLSKAQRNRQRRKMGASKARRWRGV